MVSVSFSLSYIGLIVMVAALFIIIIFFLYWFRTPKRKWVSFGLSAVSLAYILYMMVWHESIGTGPMFDWFCVGIVGVAASLGLAGIGVMDLVKPVALPVVVHNDAQPTVISPAEDDAEQQEAIVEDEQSEEERAAAEEKKHKEELIGKVMPWFYDQLEKYDDEELSAIKACAITFVHENVISEPEVAIGISSHYPQGKIIEMCSAFYLLGHTKDDCVTFVKRVFAEAFANTEDSTIAKKIKGADRMQILIDTYWEAKEIPTKNNT